MVEAAFANRRRITVRAFAKAIGVSESTVRNHMKHHGISRAMDRISDAELDRVVEDFRATRPDSGLRYLEGRIRGINIRVQRDRIRKAAKRVYGAGAARLRKAKIVRREFWVAALNALWSVDGHHKLIMYGIVIHGFIEAFSRLVSL